MVAASGPITFIPLPNGGWRATLEVAPFETVTVTGVSIVNARQVLKAALEDLGLDLKAQR